MKLKAAICVALIAAGTAPVAAQSCGDDIAGLTVDDDGNYVIAAPPATKPAPGEANMSRAPAPFARAVMSPRVRTERPRMQDRDIPAGSAAKAPTAAPRS